jgi:hypothetical protein
MRARRVGLEPAMTYRSDLDHPLQMALPIAFRQAESQLTDHSEMAAYSHHGESFFNPRNC